MRRAIWDSPAASISGGETWREKIPNFLCQGRKWGTHIYPYCQFAGGIKLNGKSMRFVPIDNDPEYFPFKRGLIDSEIKISATQR